ncbi:MAG TPA: hypothetical protein VK629_15815 [Steroidobacteraceae bacterium]|nr:hypothetical protein [Steroidobacteraceae bacterium]
MFLIEIYLPAATPPSAENPKEAFRAVRLELTEKFGGVTAFLRAPAAGLWQDPQGNVQRDEIVIFEVMAKRLDRKWWAEYRKTLEKRFQQESILVHASLIETL